MKKKQLILCAGFMILILLLCAAAGAARAEQPHYTEEEWLEFLESLPDDQIQSDLSLGSGFTIDGRKISVSTSEASVSDPDGSNQRTIPVSVDGSWCEISDDAVLIQETDASRFIAIHKDFYPR